MKPPDQGMIYLYGPPGSGKTTVGRLLAEQLALPFIDLDEQIASVAHKTIPEIFASQGETSFRRLESEQLAAIAAQKPAVIALGGGALLTEENRRLAEENGAVVCLASDPQDLLERLWADSNRRPLINSPGSSANMDATVPEEDQRLRLFDLLRRRSEHYTSFNLQVDTSVYALQQVVDEIQVRLGRFRIAGMGQPYDVLVYPGGLSALGQSLQERSLYGPLAVVSDTNVAPYYAGAVLDSLHEAGYQASLATIPAGEQYKTMATVETLWSSFLAARLDRSSTVIALGGGVVGDLAGFAAATYLRGVRWVAAPTTLLAMVDASLGGKTGADLPQGKNLVGTFYPPSLVLADPNTLRTLPEAELRSGLAEVVKHGVIADPILFDLCAQGWSNLFIELISRAMAVKIRFVQDDPYERGKSQGAGRAALNLGHTLGHALELASDYRLRHGEAVAIGMVAVARHAERIGLAEPGLATQIAAVLDSLGLPTQIPADLDRERIIASGGLDKKRRGGKVRLVLPVRIGEVRVGYELENWDDLLY